MKTSNKPHNYLSYQEPYFNPVPGLNAPAIDTKLLK